MPGDFGNIANAFVNVNQPNAQHNVAPPYYPPALAPQLEAQAGPEPQGARGMPTLQEKLVTEYENLNRDRPYVPYGAHLKSQADRLRAKKLRYQRGQRLTDVFSPQEMQLILSDDNFAQQILSEYAGRAATPNAIKSFRNKVVREHPEVLPNGNPLPGEEQYFGRFGYLPPEQQGEIRQQGLARIANNAHLESQAQNLLRQSSRLAPLNPLHNEAKAHLQANSQRGNESLRLAEDEIRAASRLSVPREIAPYLAQASESPAAFLREYEMNYAPVIAKYREEASKDFLENDLPTINNQFASKGAFYSGARMAAIDKAKADKDRRLESDIVKMLTHGREAGMRDYHEHRSGTLKQAEIAGHGRQAEQDARLRGAEALRLNMATGQVGAHQQAAALSQLGRNEQEQAQNELNVAQQEHEKEQERPYMDLSRKAAIAGGFPSPNPQLSAASMNPPPPNAYGMGAGLLGQMVGLAGQQQQHQPGGFATGGHVRQKYAGGDSVTRAANQLQQMQQHLGPSPEHEEMKQAAQSFKNHRANPMADYLFAAGSHQLANLHEDPMKTFGQGSQMGMQAYKSAQGENLNAAEKYHNLIGKINQTKMDQHQFLATYHSQMQQQEEMVRQHNTQNAETRRAHDMIFARQQDRERPGSSLSFPSKEAEKIFYKREGKAEEEHEKRAEDLASEKTKLSNVSKYIKEGIGPTGPYVGMLPDIMATAFSGKESLANRRLFEKEINREVIELTKELKGTPSDTRMAYLKRTIPTKLDDERTIEKYMSKWGAGVKRAEEGIKFIDERVAQGMPKQEAKKQWTRYELENPLDIEADSFGQEQSASGNDEDVLMRGPDGFEIRIPKKNVETAIQRGATVVG